MGTSIIVLGETREAIALRRALPASLARATPGGGERREAGQGGHGGHEGDEGHGGAEGAAGDGAVERLVIDARHPFDDAVDPAALAEAASAHVGYLRLTRPLWRPEPSDDWRDVADAAAARRALEPGWRRPFLTLGRDRLSAFAGDRDRLYLVRVRGGGERLDLARYRVLGAEGPYAVDEEAALMAREAVDVLVTRNVGGAGAFPKVEAARRLGLPVVMVAPPRSAVAVERIATASTVEDALAWVTDWARTSARTSASRRELSASPSDAAS